MEFEAEDTVTGVVTVKEDRAAAAEKFRLLLARNAAAPRQGGLTIGAEMILPVPKHPMAERTLGRKEQVEEILNRLFHREREWDRFRFQNHGYTAELNA